MSKDRGAEQGDVGGPLECSLALGTVQRREEALPRGKRRAPFP